MYDESQNHKRASRTLSYKIDSSQKISEAVFDAMREDGLTKHMLEHKAESLWQILLGQTVIKATNSVWVKDGIMHVSLNSSVVRNELFKLKGQIIKAINKAVGQDIIKDIRYS